MNGHS
jgi:WD40 repeat protein